MVEKYLAKNFRVTDTATAFLDAFFEPIPSEDISEIVDIVKKETFILVKVTNGEKAQEKAFYEPFASLANKILCAYRGPMKIHSYWTTRANNPVKSLKDENIADIRPDGACVVGDIRTLLELRERIKLFSDELNNFALNNLGKEPKDPLPEVFNLPKFIEATLLFAANQAQTLERKPAVKDICTQIHDRMATLCENPDKASLCEALDFLVQVAKAGTGDWKPLENEGDDYKQLTHRINNVMEKMWERQPFDSADALYSADIDKAITRLVRGKVKTLSRAQLENMRTLWWLRIGTPIEMKPTSSVKHRQEGSAQICRYMQTVLKTQLCRKFVFGLLICNHHLRMFYCDRSGLIASAEWINLKTDHDKFIRLIVNLSALDPCHLGWDQNMRLCSKANDKEKPELIFSRPTDPDVTLDNYGSSAYDTNWAIFVPEADIARVGRWYLTVKPISVDRSEVMVGRATLIWAVKALNHVTDFTNEGPVHEPGYEKGRVRILKHTWSLYGDPTESTYHGVDAMANVARITSSVKAGFSDRSGICVEDSTRSLRYHIPTISASWNHGIIESSLRTRTGTLAKETSVETSNTTGKAKGKQTDKGMGMDDNLDNRNDNDNDEGKDTGDKGGQVTGKGKATDKTTRSKGQGSSSHPDQRVPVFDESRNPKDDAGKVFTSRILTYTLIESYGWPIHFFASLEELVRTMRDAIQGHRNLYFGRGVLHRDISEGNILISPGSIDKLRPGPNVDHTTYGCLIDLDHAKQSLQRIKYDPRGLDFDYESRKFIGSKLSNYAGLGSKLDDIWRRCQGDDGETYTLARQFPRIEKSRSDFDKVMDALCFPSEEQYRRWLDESQSISRPPSWKDVFSGGPERTGTYLFMSYEVLFGEAYPRGMSDDYPHRNRPDIGKTGTPIHSAIHDLESFFWVLVYQCFVRNGPGGRRRREVMPGRSMTTRLNALFNNKNPVQKLKLFKYPDLFERDVVPDFHPYFNRLKPLVLEWWHLLICTYRTYDDVTQGLIHDKILGLLDKHLDGIVSGEPDEAEMSPKAIRREQAELRRREDECNQLAISTLWDGPSEVNAEGQDQDVDLDSSGDESSPGGDINEYLED